MKKNITLSADADLIENARRVARAENKTLNTVFREWLEQYQGRGQASLAYRDVMAKLAHGIADDLLPALMPLERDAAMLQAAPLAEREWFELLRQKLIPQLGEQAFLVVAIAVVRSTACIAANASCAGMN